MENYVLQSELLNSNPHLLVCVKSELSIAEQGRVTRELWSHSRNTIALSPEELIQRIPA